MMEVQNQVEITKKIYFDGRWVATEGVLDVSDPATGKVFGQVHTINQAQLQDVLKAAQAALPAWRSTTAKDRGAMLHKIADELVRRKDEIARILCRENGKPLAQCLGEIATAEDHLRWFAEEGKRAYGRVIPNQVKGKRHVIVKTPIGVVGAISPWNFPLVLAVRKVAPALAAGCPVILKPASATPLCAIAFAECCEAAGLPAGVLQLAIGKPSMIADELVANDICRKITFTGSTPVGIELIRNAARYVKPLSLELGGQAPLLVFDDCDLDKAVAETIIAKFRNNGQSCIASNRIYVQKTVYKQFVAKLVDATRALKTGPGLEPGVDVGPLINQAAVDGVLEQIDDAVKRGGSELVGGKRVGREGYFGAPTLDEGGSEDGHYMREETFARMAPV
ncbi:MAG: aldehyde dehydrogenase family protein, partial [Acidobacteriaceae bacterium]|nr:aldehyde dehydrogenase family protein [Acidobacteriaceae bacterium]